ncbi:MAG: hotdog domain-containing protein [Pseudonocardia sp.]
MSFALPVHVHYLEVDAQGMVFNAWYLTYFDDAMTAFLERGRLSYRTSCTRVRRAAVRSEIDYRAWVRSEDPIMAAVSTSCFG